MSYIFLETLTPSLKMICIYEIKIFGKFWYLSLNTIIMGQRIIISEEEKRNIQKMYNVIKEQSIVDIVKRELRRGEKRHQLILL